MVARPENRDAAIQADFFQGTIKTHWENQNHPPSDVVLWPMIEVLICVISDEVVKSPFMAFLLHGKRKVW